MTPRVTGLVATLVAALTLAATPALASLSDEVAAGQSVASGLQSGRVTCNGLTRSDFEHLGEYVMERMVGSRSVHAAMNARMEQMMGSENADRMHALLGRTYAGCASATAGTGGGMMGSGGMMGGTGGGIMGWGAMMGSSTWSWMHNGSWQHMSRGQWQQLANSMMGGNVSFSSGDGWSTGAVVGVVLGSLLLGALLAVVLVLVRRRWRHHPPGASAA